MLCNVHVTEQKREEWVFDVAIFEKHTEIEIWNDEMCILVCGLWSLPCVHALQTVEIQQIEGSEFKVKITWRGSRVLWPTSSLLFHTWCGCYHFWQKKNASLDGWRVNHSHIHEKTAEVVVYKVMCLFLLKVLGIILVVAKHNAFKNNTQWSGHINCWDKKWLALHACSKSKYW